MVSNYFRTLGKHLWLKLDRKRVQKASCSRILSDCLHFASTGAVLLAPCSAHPSSYRQFEPAESKEPESKLLMGWFRVLAGIFIGRGVRSGVRAASQSPGEKICRAGKVSACPWRSRKTPFAGDAAGSGLLCVSQPCAEVHRKASPAICRRYLLALTPCPGTVPKLELGLVFPLNPTFFQGAAEDLGCPGQFTCRLKQP